MNIKLLFSQLISTYLIGSNAKYSTSTRAYEQIFTYENWIDCQEANTRLNEVYRREEIGIHANTNYINYLKFFSEDTCLSESNAKLKVFDPTYFGCKTEPCQPTDEDYNMAVKFAI